MAWLSRNNVAPTDSLTADMLNSLANDIRFWGGDVNAGGYKLTNVILSGTGGFERTPSPAIISPVAAGGSSEVQLSDYVAGTPDTFPPRWKMSKAADPTPDFSIERYNQFGSLIDKPLSIRMADGIVVLKAQQWTGPVNGEGQTLTNVTLGSGVVIPPEVIPTAAQTPWKQAIDGAGFPLNNAGMSDFAGANAANYANAAIQVRESLRQSGINDIGHTPRIAFRWEGIGAVQIGAELGGQIVRTFTANGDAYANINAATGDFAAPATGTSQPGVVIRAALRGPGPISAASTPKLMFHWAGIGFSQIGMDDKDGGAIRTYNGAGDGWANFTALAVNGWGGLFTPSDIGINRDVNGKRIWDGPAAIFRMDPASTGNIFMALYPNGAAGTVVSDPSFPLNFAPGVRMGIGAWNLPKVQVDSDQFHARYIVQPGDFAHSWNLDVSSGQWKHVAAGYGNVITNSLGDGNLRIYASGSGAAGAVASLQAVAYFGPGSVRFVSNSVYINGATAAANAWHTFAPWDNAYSPRFGVGMTGDTTRYFVARYNDSGVWINDPISVNRATGVVTITTLDKASLGSGTPDSTKYLRGDGVWAVPPGAGGGQPQTPWAQNIDGATYSLYNAGTIQVTTARTPSSGSGLELIYDGVGHISPIVRPSNTVKELRVYGTPLSLYYGINGESVRVESGKVSVFADGVFSGYVESAVGKGFAGNLYYDGTNFRYRAAGAGCLLHASSAAPWSAIYTAPTGAAGATATITASLTFRDDGFIETPQRLRFTFAGSELREVNAAMHFKRTSGQACAIAMGSGGGINGTSVLGCMPNSDTFVIGLENGSWVVDAIRFKYPSATVSSVEIPGILAMSNTNGERIILYDGGGGTGGAQNTSMGIESNAWWFKCHSAGNFRWYVGNPPDGGPSVKAEINGYGLTVKGTVCVGGGNAMTLNAHYTDTWRYQGPGNAPAFAMYGDWNMNSIRIMAGVTGAPGNAIAFTETMQMHPSFVKILVQFALGYVPTSASGLASGSVWRDAAAGNVLKIVP